MEKFLDLMKDHVTGMTDFQDNYFVTYNAGKTPYGQYCQALRELYKRFRGLKQLYSQYEKTKIDIEELEFKISELSNKVDKKSYFELKRAQIDLNDKILNIEETERSIKDTKREFITFYKQVIYLKEYLGELTEERKAELEKETWIHKFKEMACEDFLLNGKLTKQTFEAIHSLPTEMKSSLLKEIKDHNTLIEWYENKEDLYIPENLDYIEIPRLNKFLEIDFKKYNSEV